MTVYLLMAALALFAAVLVTRPWWSRGHAGRVQRRAANIAAYKTRLTEIENDASSGLLSAESAETLKKELAARLLVDAQADTATHAANNAARPPHGKWPAVAAVLLLPAFAAVWYYGSGSWRTQQIIEAARSDPQAAQGLAVQAMVDGLAKRLQKNPDDVDGWAMLGRSYFVMQRYADAAKAYAKANELSNDQSADLLVEEGEALAIARDHDLQGRPQQRFDAALKLDPAHGKALWYAGLSAAQARDYKAAQQRWLALSRQELPQDLREALAVRLEELSKLTGEPLPQSKPVRTGAAGIGLQVQVELAPELAGKLTPEQTLFVFAKAESGPPMPLAVQRLPGPRLPLQVMLDDSMAMMPQLKLSHFDRWVVTARLTRGGTVKAQSGDLEGQAALGRAESGKPLRVVINRVIP